jgi:hypothetical protein
VSRIRIPTCHVKAFNPVVRARYVSDLRRNEEVRKSGSLGPVLMYIRMCGLVNSWTSDQSNMVGDNISMALGSILLTALLLLVRQSARDESSERKPPIINQWCPFLGRLIVLLPFSKQLLAIARYWLGDVFSLKIYGRTIHVILDPSCITQMFREHRTFSFFKIMDQGEKILLRIPHPQAADPVLRKATIASMNHDILSQHGVDELSEKFNKNLAPILRKTLQQINVDGKLSGTGVVLDMRAMITTVFIECASKTFFGDSWELDDSLVNDATIFEACRPTILK